MMINTGSRIKSRSLVQSRLSSRVIRPIIPIRFQPDEKQLIETKKKHVIERALVKYGPILVSYDMSQSSVDALRWTLENTVGTQAFQLHKEDPFISQSIGSGWESMHAEGWDEEEIEANTDILIVHVVSDELSFQSVTSTGFNVHSDSHGGSHSDRGGQFETIIKEHSRRLMSRIKQKCFESIKRVFSAYQRRSSVTFSLLLCPHFTSPPSAATTGEILVKEGEMNHARMLIIASHGPVGSMAHVGSISRHVWHHSINIPVLLIPPHPPPSENGKTAAIVSQPDVVVIVEDEDQLRECSQFLAECLVRPGDSVHVWFCGPSDKQPVPQSIALDIETSIIAQSSCEGVYSKGFSSSSLISASALKSPLGLFGLYEEDNDGPISQESSSLPETISSILDYYKSIRVVCVFDPCGGAESRSIKCEVTRGEMLRHLVKSCPLPLAIIPPSMPKAPVHEVREEQEEMEMRDPLSSDSEEEMSRNY